RSPPPIDSVCRNTCCRPKCSASRRSTAATSPAWSPAAVVDEDPAHRSTLVPALAPPRQPTTISAAPSSPGSTPALLSHEVPAWQPRLAVQTRERDLLSHVLSNVTPDVAGGDPSCHKQNRGHEGTSTGRRRCLRGAGVPAAVPPRRGRPRRTARTRQLPDGKAQVLDQEADVLRVRPASGQHLHGQQVLGRSRRHTQA